MGSSCSTLYYFQHVSLKATQSGAFSQFLSRWSQIFILCPVAFLVKSCSVTSHTSRQSVLVIVPWCPQQSRVEIAMHGHSQNLIFFVSLLGWNLVQGFRLYEICNENFYASYFQK